MTNRILDAVLFAIKAHAGQERKDGSGPYALHVVEVGKILEEHGCDEDIVVAGILHDIVEDTETTLHDVDNRFGDTVMKIVSDVTDDPEQSKEEQKRAQLAMMKDKNVFYASKMVKLADAISNCGTLSKRIPAGWTPKKALGYIAFKTLFAKEILQNHYDVLQEHKLATTLIRIGWSSEPEIHERGYTIESLAEEYLRSRRDEEASQVTVQNTSKKRKTASDE